MIRIASKISNGINILPKQKLTPFRSISVSSCLCANRFTHEKKGNEPKIRWSKLYHFTDIQYLSIVTKLKIYPAVATAIGTPVVIGILATGVLEEFTALPLFAIGEKNL